jgi:hypothetical protein
VARHRKIPIGPGTYFVLSASTLRIPLEGPDGRAVADLLVNAQGHGGVVAVPPGCDVQVAGSEAVTKLGPLEAVELLRRVNVFRLSRGAAAIDIPPPLLKRAKSEQLPGLEALVPFPGVMKEFFAGQGTWSGTGLWLSARGEAALEMAAGGGVLRKLLTLDEAGAWLESNGYQVPWSHVAGGKQSPSPPAPQDVWEIVTRGVTSRTSPVPPILEHGVAVDRHNAAEQVAAVRAKSRAEHELRSAVAKAPRLVPPPISPPVKTRAPTRKRRPAR